MDRVIRTALAAYYVPDVEAPANFSVVVPRSDKKEAAKGLNMLYEGYTNLVRSRSPERVMRALFQHLSKYLSDENNGYLRCSYLALVREGQSILVPRGITTWMDQLAPRLNRAGWQFVDHPWSTLDLPNGEIVVPPAVLEVDDSWKQQIRRPTTAREPETVGPGRYPLAGWGVFSAEERLMSPAAGVAAAAAGILNAGEYGVRDTIEQMLRFVQRVPITGLGSPAEGNFPGRIAALGGSRLS